MKPDIKTAKECLEKGGFSEYSKAYIVTNEHLRLVLKYIPKQSDILTVAASGDQPLFWLLREPKSVDTFDVSYNAKVIMDIKTAAIPRLPFGAYRNLLNGLYEEYDIKDIYEMPEIIKTLPAEEQEYIEQINGKGFIRSDMTLFFSSYLFMQKPEYKKVKERLHGPFNFIWTDITSLHTKLNKTYDFIFLSNIFDYASDKQITDVLLSLVPYVNLDGKIYFESNKLITKAKWLTGFSNNVLNKYNQEYKCIVKKSNKYKCVLQRTR